MSNYYQPEIETMPYEDLRALQNERFMKQIRHVWDNVPYYRAKMESNIFWSLPYAIYRINIRC